MALQERRGYIDGRFGQMHYRSWGSGTQPLLLLHQTPWSSMQYLRVAPILAADRLVIALDTPGYGMSTEPPAPPQIGDYADALPGFLDGLGQDRVDVLGHHTGALIATAFAARHPGRVNRLIVHGLPVYDAEERAQRLAQPHFDQTPRADASHFAEYWGRVQRVVGVNAKPLGLHLSVLNFYLNGPQEWYGHHAAFTYDCAADLPALQGPALVISNTADTIAHHAARLRAVRPEFSYTEFAGGSSNMIVDEPERWAAPVAAWLASGAIPAQWP